MKRLVFLLIVITGCADDPVVDNRGRSDARYQKDLSECRDNLLHLIYQDSRNKYV